MTALSPHVHLPADAEATLRRDLARADHLADLLDDRFEIAGIKFGLDFLIGLLPVAGDAATTAVGLYPVFLAYKHKLGGLLVGRMLWNLLLDFLVGLIPLLGDVGDLAFKANRRNYELFKKAADKRLGREIIA